jgi:hypothetical protein
MVWQSIVGVLPVDFTTFVQAEKGGKKLVKLIAVAV